MASIFVEIAEKLGVLEKLKNKIFEDPSEGFNELSEQLQEFIESFLLIDRFLTQFLSISTLSIRNNLQQSRELLLRIEGGIPGTEAYTLRFNCNKLRNLYRTRLSPTLASRLAAQQLAATKQAFQCLEDFHEESLPKVRDLMSWLANTARDALDKVDSGEFEEADRLIMQARLEVLPQRQAISSAVNVLVGLQSAYLDATRRNEGFAGG